MKTSKLWSIMMMLVYVLFTTVVLTSCSKDDDPEIGGGDEDKIEQNLSKGVKAIDLGLSVKWANMNVGAKTPEGYGEYFAWGETEPKTEYTPYNYRLRDHSKEWYTYTKYNQIPEDGIVDNKTTLELEDDAAHVYLGGTWRMPTFAELAELLENCTWTWTTQNGVNGYKVASKRNSNSIFLPASGVRRESGNLYSVVGTSGAIWSSSLGVRFAYVLSFSKSGYVNWGNAHRYDGYSVRAVCP